MITAAWEEHLAAAATHPSLLLSKSVLVKLPESREKKSGKSVGEKLGAAVSGGSGAVKKNLGGREKMVAYGRVTPDTARRSTACWIRASLFS